jgi:hypothetical protein
LQKPRPPRVAESSTPRQISGLWSSVPLGYRLPGKPLRSGRWAEGLATYVSAALYPDNPISDSMIFPPDLAERAAPQIAQLARTLRDNDAPNPSLYAEYFETDSTKNGIPPRAGYYVGYRVAALAAREHSLYQLAHLHGPALHRDINRWLDQLVNGKGG